MIKSTVKREDCLTKRVKIKNLLQLLRANCDKMYPKQLMMETFDGITFQPSKRLKVVQILVVILE